MLSKEQLHIFAGFREDPFTGLTFKDLKDKSNQRSNNLVQRAIKAFMQNNLVIPSKTGDVTSYMINLESNRALALLNMINEEELGKKKIPNDLLREVQTRLLRQTRLFILIVFGSYAKGKATSTSDLDIAIIVQSKEAKKGIEARLETTRRREIITVDYHVFSETEFIEMLKAEYENLGKQIEKNNLIIYGYIPYLNLLKAHHG